MKLVLVVGDIPGTKKMVSGILASASYEVAQADDSKQAITFIQTFSPDLLLVDVRLADLQASHLIEECGKRKTPMVVMTSHPDAIRAVQANVLASPFTSEQLLDSVRCALDPASCTTERCKPVKHGGAVSGAALSMFAVVMLLIVTCTHLFVLLPTQRKILQRQQDVETMLAEIAKHETLLKEARNREAVNQAKLLVHQELALRLLKKGER